MRVSAVGKGIAWICAIAVAALAAGCDQEALLKGQMDRMIPEDDDAYARAYLETIRSRDFETALSLVDEQFVKPGAEAVMEKMAALLDQGDPISVEVVGFNLGRWADRTRSTLTYQYQFADSWLLAQVAVETAGGTRQVVGVNVIPRPISLREENALTLAGKGVKAYAMLILATVIPLFIVYSLVVCIRTKLKRRKWLWIIFILVGVGKVQLNWTAGVIVFNLLSIHIQLLGSSVTKGGIYAPWILSVSIPLGAILFLVRRKRLRLAPVAASHEPEDVASAEDAEPGGRADIQ